MFYLDGRNARYRGPEENFGWWLHQRDIMRLFRSRQQCHRSSEGSSASMLSCVDSDDSNSCAFTQDLSRRENGIYEYNAVEDDLDVDSIETDAIEAISMDSSLMTASNNERNGRRETKVVCYTPERLIRCQEYRILTPSPRSFTSWQKFIPKLGSSWRYRFGRKNATRRSSRSVDAWQSDASQLYTLLNPVTHMRAHEYSPPGIIVESYPADDFTTPTRSTEDLLICDREYHVQSTETISSHRSDCDRLNSTWNDCKDPVICRYSPEDTSGIQSNDWSLETQSDERDASSPMHLYDELAVASGDRSFSNSRVPAINEVASILEGLHDDPEKATVLLNEEDRFYDCTSSHDQLTRLALAIETDTEVATTPNDPDNWLRRLSDKIERLQLDNKEIQRDICSLRTDFQYDEKKIKNLLSTTTELRQDVYNLRYFDDLLKLLDGELEKISKRNWPFILGHDKPRKERNLII